MNTTTDVFKSYRGHSLFVKHHKYVLELRASGDTISGTNYKNSTKSTFFFIWDFESSKLLPSWKATEISVISRLHFHTKKKLSEQSGKCIVKIEDICRWFLKAQKSTFYPSMCYRNHRDPKLMFSKSLSVYIIFKRATKTTVCLAGLVTTPSVPAALWHIPCFKIKNNVTKNYEIDTIFLKNWKATKLTFWA